MVVHHDGGTVRDFSDHGPPWCCLHGICVLLCLLENISLNNRANGQTKTSGDFESSVMFLPSFPRV